MRCGAALLPQGGEGGAAVLGAAFGGVVGGDGAGLAVAAVGEAVGADAAEDEVVVDGLGAALGEGQVVLVLAHGVGVPAHLEAQARMALEGFGQAVEAGLGGFVEFGAGGEEVDVAEGDGVAEREEVLGLEDGVDEGDAFGLHGGGHDEGVEVLAAIAAEAVAAEDGGAAVGGHDEVVLLAGGVDGVAEVFHVAPSGVGGALGAEEVHAAHAEVAVGGEVEGAVVEVDEGCGLVAGGVDFGAEVAGFAPAAFLEGAAPDVGAAVAAGAGGDEIERVAVDGERGEGLPIGGVDGVAEVLRAPPAVALADGHIDIARGVLARASAGGEDDHAPVVREGLGALVAVAVEGFGHALGGAPVEFHGVVEREVEVLLLRQAGLCGGAAGRTAGEDELAVVGGEGGQVLVVGGVDVGAEVDGTEGDGVLDGMLAEVGGADAVARLAAPAFAAGVEAEAVLVALAGVGMALEHQVLVAEQEPRFDIAGVEVEGAVEEADGLLVAAGHAVFDGLVEEGFALFGLGRGCQRQQD